MRELVLHCLEAQAEALSDALLEAGVLSVSVEDADFGTDDERPLFGEPGTEPDVQAWDRNRVVALLPDGADPAQIMAEAAEAGELDPALFQDWSLRDVPDADWVRLTQSQFGPIQVAERLWIVPSWHRDNPDVPGLDLDAPTAPSTSNSIRAWLSALAAIPRPTCAWPGSKPSCRPARRCWTTAAARASWPSPRASWARADPGGGHRSASRAEHRVQRPGQRRRAGRHAARRPEGRHVPGRGRQYPVEPAEGAGAHAGRPRRARRATGAPGVLERQAEEVAAAYAPWIAMSVWRARDGWVCLHGRKA